MAKRKLKPVEANDGSYAGKVLAAYDSFCDPSDDYCPNCGGEGVVYSCFEEWACVDPEGGCDLCERRCDWCRPSRPDNSQTKGASS